MMMTLLLSRIDTTLQMQMLFCSEKRMTSNSLVALPMGLSVVLTRGYVIVANDLNGKGSHITHAGMAGLLGLIGIAECACELTSTPQPVRTGGKQ